MCAHAIEEGWRINNTPIRCHRATHDSCGCTSAIIPSYIADVHSLTRTLLPRICVVSAARLRPEWETQSAATHFNDVFTIRTSASREVFFTLQNRADQTRSEVRTLVTASAAASRWHLSALSDAFLDGSER